jgi:uncharacterized OsmC-like protein
VGTFGGALVARKIVADRKLTGEVRGEVEKTEDGVLVIKRIHVELRLRAKKDEHPAAERALSVYAISCPLYRSINRSIEISSSLTFIPED